MLRYLSIILTVVITVFSSCADTTNEKDLVKSQTGFSLKNQYSGKIIKSVLLVGYEFDHLSIVYGGSQTFTLDNGMPAGYKRINVIVSYGSGTATWYTNKDFDFIEGKIIAITLWGSDGEGDPNFNNPHLE